MAGEPRTAKCPATREAVEEQEENGEVGCPICGRPADAHPSEVDQFSLDTADRALAVPHREDDRPCGCDSCMDYGAEDEGFDWTRIPPANRIAIRVLDSGDDRFALLVTALREHAEAAAPASSAGLDGLRAALDRLEARPTTDIETLNARTLFDKAKRSATQEVTITAQALRMLLPAIENEAKAQIFRALRAALATSTEEPRA
jgi:hypothetical protein